ncbi:MAG: hypothetical protein ABIO81_06005 [Ginsengibacter sp.]
MHGRTIALCAGCIQVDFGKVLLVIESNITTPLNSIVYFYNNQKLLAYKEKMQGMKINLKKRVLMNFKDILEQSVTAWGRATYSKRR